MKNVISRVWEKRGNRHTTHTRIDSLGGSCLEGLEGGGGEGEGGTSTLFAYALHPRWVGEYF